MADTETLVVMLVQPTGKNDDIQWFTYMPGFFSPPVRIEWDKDTKFAALPVDTAGYLLNHGYARLMTEAEVEAYTAPTTKGDQP